jgi:hypothetical protein
MDQPFSQVLSEKFECPVEEVHSHASDQNDRYSGKRSESSKSLCRQQTVSLGISPNYVKQWDTTAAFRELYQNW